MEFDMERLREALRAQLAHRGLAPLTKAAWPFEEAFVIGAVAMLQAQGMENLPPNLCIGVFTRRSILGPLS